MFVCLNHLQYSNFLWSAWIMLNKISEAWKAQIPRKAKASSGLACSHSMHSERSPPPQCVQAFTIFRILLLHHHSHCRHSRLLKCCRAHLSRCFLKGLSKDVMDNFCEKHYVIGEVLRLSLLWTEFQRVISPYLKTQALANCCIWVSESIQLEALTDVYLWNDVTKEAESPDGEAAAVR